jgi:signal transduction histidine kinase
VTEAIGTGRAAGARDAIDSKSEMQLLREELARYRSLFDSASLIVGHELIKPLTAISGYVELLESRLESACGEDEKRYFSRLDESITRLHGLVESFLQLLRSECADEQAGTFERIDLRDLVEELRPKDSGTRTRLRNAVDPGMPPLLVRRKHLEVVLENLISNAMKHAGDGVPVTVSAEVMRNRRGNAGEEVLIVRVSDEGVGIPANELEEIFHPFYRIDPEDRTGGLGLGLALVRNMIDLMGGEIRVSSCPGEGTEVTFSVPLRGKKAAPVKTKRVK